MTQSPPDTSPQSGWVLLAVFLIVSLTVTGYFVGLQAPMNPAGVDLNRAAVAMNRTPSASQRDANGETIVPSTSYANMGRVTRARAASWQSRMSDLKSSIDPLGEVIIPPGAKELALTRRATRRAYNGAPPTIPHPIDQHSSQACVACHGQGVRTVSLRIPKMPHPFYASCTQCHVESRSQWLVATNNSDPRDEESEPPDGLADDPDVSRPEQSTPYQLAKNALMQTGVVDNGFVGLAAPTGGPRAYAGAPPQIPHSTWMRSDCHSCHGVAGQLGMRSTHPWRQSCEQCHAPSAALDHVPLEPQPRFLPPPNTTASP